MKKEPLISVVMPVFNGEKYLAQAIDSILTQTYRNFEFIIIDDGSTDSTGSMVAQINDKRVRVISHQKNKGIVISLNDGIMASRGKYIARMDADDVSHQSRFLIQVEFLNKNPDIVVVGTFLKITSPEGKLLFTIEQPTRDQAIKNFLLQDSCLAHGSVMMRKSAVVKVGMYSTSKKVHHAEDYDLFTRLGAKYKLANIPEYLYIRKEHLNSVSHQNYAIQQRSASYICQRAKKLIKLPSKPRFSVLMPTYNKAKYIKDAIKSVIAQTFTDWELIIIDDASTDNTRELVRPYLQDKRIIYLKNPINLGKSKTRNRLVKESLAEIFGELDSDDALAPTALANMYLAHQQHQSVGFMYSQFVYCDQKLRPTGPGFCRESRLGETYLHANFASAFRTYKRQYFNQTSGFDVNCPGAEDRDIIYKMEEVAPIKFVDKVLYQYRIIPNRANNDKFIGLLSHVKAKYFAYTRRRANHLPNITFFALVKQLLNLLYSAITL